MLTVLDYGGGNLKSVVNMLDSFGFPYRLTDKAEDIDAATQLIFPGQGHFGQVMDSLRFKGLAEPLLRCLNKGVPFLGICVGLQVLFDSSEEAPGVTGLGVFKGKNVRFTQGKVPQIGWNKIKTTAANTVLQDDFYYFVNSYHAVAENPRIVSASADYHIPFTAAVQFENITATQFHPEKSGLTGHTDIRNWITSFGVNALA